MNIGEIIREVEVLPVDRREPVDRPEPVPSAKPSPPVEGPALEPAEPSAA